MIVRDITHRPDLAKIASEYAPDRNWNASDLRGLHYEILKGSIHPIQSLQGWTFAIDDAGSRLGHCRYGPRQIGISRFLFDSNNRAQIVRTLAHEMAHAMVRIHHGAGPRPHGHEWKSFARMLGHPGTRIDGTDSESVHSALIRVGNRTPGFCSRCGGTTSFGPRQVKRYYNYASSCCRAPIWLGER